MYINREVFPASPLALVAAEIRFSDSARLRQQNTLDNFALTLEKHFPVAEPLHQANFNVTATAPPQVEMTLGVRLKNLENTASLTVTAGSMAYETTAYTEFSEFLDAVVSSCAALVDAGVTPAVQRIGVRYIDEIRVPTMITDARQWAAWIDNRLIDHLNVGPRDKPVGTAQGIIAYDLGEGRGLNFRFAALNQNAVVTPMALKRETFQSGPFFVLDFDGFQDFSTQETTLLSPEVVRKIMMAVHDPAGETFQNAITDKARELFRGRTK